MESMFFADRAESYDGGEYEVLGVITPLWNGDYEVAIPALPEGEYDIQLEQQSGRFVFHLTAKERS